MLKGQMHFSKWCKRNGTNNTVILVHNVCARFQITSSSTFRLFLRLIIRLLLQLVLPLLLIWLLLLYPYSLRPIQFNSIAITADWVTEFFSQFLNTIHLYIVSYFKWTNQGANKYNAQLGVFCHWKNVKVDIDGCVKARFDPSGLFEEWACSKVHASIQLLIIETGLIWVHLIIPVLSWITLPIV